MGGSVSDSSWVWCREPWSTAVSVLFFPLFGRSLVRSLIAFGAMGRLGYGTVGVGSVVAMFLASCVSHGVEGFVIPAAVRGCSATWGGHGHAGRGAVRARAPTRGLEVAAGGSAVDSSSVAEDDAKRVGQIEGFTNKVCCYNRETN